MGPDRTGPDRSLFLVPLRLSAGGPPPRLHVDPGEGVGAGGGDVGLGGVEGHVVDGLLALLAVGRDLLDARLAVQVPQAQGAVVTWGGRGAGGQRREALGQEVLKETAGDSLPEIR